MTTGKHKSHSMRKISVRTPTRTTVHYRKRKPNSAQCSTCGATLPGVPKTASQTLHAMAKTKKRPQRPYGGTLCSKCMRAHFVKVARGGK